MNVVIGLGNLGFAIARRVSDCGHRVVGVDLSEDARDRWQRATGNDAVATIGDVAWSDVERVFVIVRLTSQAKAVLEELRAVGRTDLPVFLVTTLEPDFARALGAFDGGELRVVELPISGGDRGAEEGSLCVMAAGRLRAGDRELLLGTIAGYVVDFETYGEPTMAKLLNNVTLGYNARALADILVLADEHGVSPAKVYDVICHSSGSSWVATAYRTLIDDLLDKDVALLRTCLGPLPTISLAEDQDLVGRLQQARALLPEA